jgi:hypothetical protein
LVSHTSCFPHRCEKACHGVPDPVYRAGCTSPDEPFPSAGNCPGGAGSDDIR